MMLAGIIKYVRVTGATRTGMQYYLYLLQSAAVQALCQAHFIQF